MARSCAARDKALDLEVGGRYEWFLDLEPDEQGRRGSEGSKVLAWSPKKMIAFSWTFPPDVPKLRYAGEMTQVVVRLQFRPNPPQPS